MDFLDYLIRAAIFLAVGGVLALAFGVIGLANGLEEQHGAPAGTTEGNYKTLKAWVAENMPELDRELGPLSPDQVRVRLNAVTGCTVQGGDSIEDGSAVFLAALKAQHGDATGEDFV